MPPNEIPQPSPRYNVCSISVEPCNHRKASLKMPTSFDYIIDLSPAFAVQWENSGCRLAFTIFIQFVLTDLLKIVIRFNSLLVCS